MGEFMKKTVANAHGNGGPENTALAQAVLRTLEWDVVVPSEQIRATVADGVVTLEGKVDLWRQYDDAERAVRNLTSVREVRNLLAVEPPPVRARASADPRFEA
jgi:osmotically-inducible protein OsmY